MRSKQKKHHKNDFNLHLFVSKALSHSPGGKPIATHRQRTLPHPWSFTNQISSQRKINLKMQNRFQHHECTHTNGFCGQFSALWFSNGKRSSRLIATEGLQSERTQCPGKATSGIDSKLGFWAAAVWLRVNCGLVSSLGYRRCGFELEGHFWPVIRGSGDVEKVRI